MEYQPHLVLYEPYTETLSEFISTHQSLPYKKILELLIEVVKILSFLSDQCIFPDIEPSTVLVSHESIKLKIRPSAEHLLPNEREVIKQCGYYFSMLIS